MASYVVFETPGGRNSPVLVRDSFRWPAFLLPLLWFLWHRLWIEAFAVLAVTVGIVAVAETSGLTAVLAALVLLLSLALGFEAPALRMAALRRRGWKEKSVVDAENREEAEIRCLSGMEEESEPASPPPEARPARDMRPGTPGVGRPGLGLLDYPGGA
jgi:hypothetical protein